MIKIDFRRYIKNRMWFGYWFSYTWAMSHSRVDLFNKDAGNWQHDKRHCWTPMVLVWATFGDPSENEFSDWAYRYGNI